jgi:methionyl-tRNA formyltransferase
MIYVFSNVDFGKDFLEVVRARCTRRPAPAITIVLSGKRGWPASRLERIRQRLKWPFAKWRNARRLSRAIGTRVIVCDDVNAALPARVTSDDDAFVAGFNQIFKADLIARFRTLVNCHPSVLPLYRGPVPSYWCIENGETRSGYTFHRITNAIDRGEILWQEAVEILPDDTPAVLNARIGARAALTFSKYLGSLIDGDDFGSATLDAFSVYKHHVDYKSFPA